MILYTHLQKDKVTYFHQYVMGFKSGNNTPVNWQTYEWLKKVAEQTADDMDQLDEMLEIIREVLKI